jgi:hypothetical protein
MNEGDVRFMAQAMSLFVEALAINTEVQGMVADNMAREYYGESMAFPGDSFGIKGNYLQKIAIDLRNL